MYVTPYLSFNGDCKAAFEHYHSILGGTVVDMIPYGDTPSAGHVPPERKDRIMHAYLRAGDLELMGGDSMGGDVTPQGFCVSLHVDTIDEAERIFAALAENGQVTMPIGETFWAARFGMLIDRFGTPWMVNYSPVS